MIDSERWKAISEQGNDESGGNSQMHRGSVVSGRGRSETGGEIGAEDASSTLPIGRESPDQRMEAGGDHATALRAGSAAGRCSSTTTS